ncbi:MAG: hypothetical protein WCS04_07960 [Sphaerochaetaceae bacterium]
MYKLNAKSKSYIKNSVGLSFESIIEMNSSDVDSQIEKKINKKLKHKSSRVLRSTGRGTPFLYLWRLVNINAIDRLLSKI